MKGKVFYESYEDHDYGAGRNGGHEAIFEPLPGAYVRWSGSEDVRVTDGFGFFKIPTVRLGDTLLVSMVGYQSAGLVYSGQDYVEIPLELGVVLEGATVVAQRSATSFSLLNPLNVQSLNRKELTKAACCNLSEAFETNASVDASFTDAVTGTRQIRMLGLDGKYSQIQVDNLPGPRGLNVIQGLLFIPGDWVNEIHISKGAGTVTQGYESITGQINVALKNPETADPLHVNLYANSAGRSEWNHVSKHRINRKWSTVLLTHALYNNQVNDRNEDGFLDTPMQRRYIARNEWKFIGDRGIRSEYAVTWAQTETAAGQSAGFAESQPWGDVMKLLDESGEHWTAATAIDRFEASLKSGFVFPNAEWRSIGTQWVFNRQHHRHLFGTRNYDGKEQFFRGNILYAGIIGRTNHRFTTGMSLLLNEFSESVVQPGSTEAEEFGRRETVPGAFFEYTWNHAERIQLIGGLRYDQYTTQNQNKGFWSPRLHVRWSATENTSVKLAAGRGFRSANPFMEQMGTWASQRQWVRQIEGDEFAPEVATNIGLNVTSKFELNFRDASLAVDYYNTEFENKVVVNLDESSQHIYLSNLEGRSFAKSAQVEFDWDAHRRWDVRLAYRWVDAHTERGPTLPTQDPFVSKHRAFTQLSYASNLDARGGQWRGDATIQWIGQQRLPFTGDNPESFQRPDDAPDFLQLNAQITRQISEAWDVYIGVENATNYKQDRPIIGADYDGVTVSDADFNDHFDASVVYGPIFGRMFYTGLRWKIPTAE